MTATRPVDDLYVPAAPARGRSGVVAAARAPDGELVDATTLRTTLARGLEGRVDGQRVLVLVPDHTRTAPLPLLLGILVDVLGSAHQIDIMVALGTHPPLRADALARLVGAGADPAAAGLGHIRLRNHAWRDQRALVGLGDIDAPSLRAVAGPVWHPSLGEGLPLRINRAVLDADHVVIVGPTFPHEVAGFSGGAKYLFPGVSGPEMIDVSHWLGALTGVVGTIGRMDTPVRSLIHLAAARVPTPISLVALVVGGNGGLHGAFVGDLVDAWAAAANLSATVHTRSVPRPMQRILSVAPAMYTELWTAAKAMYKLEPVLAEGGELTIFAPHLDTLSVVHGEQLLQVGYHVRDYFLGQWDRFAAVPKAVLAHSSHLRGAGTYRGGVEQPRAQVTLASRIPREVCEQLGLGWADPDRIEPDRWRGREDEGILYVPQAGETLYRVAP